MTVLDQAENVSGVVSAARLRESFKRRQANASNEEERAALGDAIGSLEVRFPELEDIPAGGAEKFARERGHGKGARSPSHEGRQRHRPAKKKSRSGSGAQKSKPAKPAPARSSSRTTSRSSSRASRVATRVDRGGTRAAARIERRYQQTGIPGATDSATQTLMQLLGGTVGLALAYLLLVSAEKPSGGSNSIVALLNTGTHALRRFITPVDILGGPPTPAPAEGASTTFLLNGKKPIHYGPGTVQTAAERLKAAGTHPGSHLDAKHRHRKGAIR